jgi:hypothetical protein
MLDGDVVYLNYDAVKIGMRRGLATKFVHAGVAYRFAANRDIT